MQWYKNRIVWVIVALVLIGGFFLFRNGAERGADTESEEVGETAAGEVSVLGVIFCLPYKTPEPGQGCVKAVKGDDGKVYALSSAKVRGVENLMPEGAKVSAIGKFEPADTSVDDASVFVYDGVLVLSSLRPR